VDEIEESHQKATEAIRAFYSLNAYEVHLFCERMAALGVIVQVSISQYKTDDGPKYFAVANKEF